ncbi:hypothetical protein CEUSTIGMA_g7060.t1 [Chlamydomonas eustigma]|uniref:Ionotropic glutamate receptor C-terminal domain-containing protein n=1 Tax=Chlamydomonas eustigma TaxID=1157962 RepID=A0A250X9Q0_9CHLO|nr:hypothetical protein CEUSTIGMA_g7060.t1 [Chlamydomonas eustigma]|eukprot:GAX79619.1 hypothetical protein CEUSTIGMA_g7060.t1 [Chlamydomonas eustigma]
MAEGLTICVVHDPPFTICPSANYEGFVQTNNFSSNPWPPLHLPPPPPFSQPPPFPPGVAGIAGVGNSAPPYPFPYDIGLGDFTIASSNADQGTIYMPYYPTGAAIMTLADGNSINPWAFINPVPAVVYFVESLTTKGLANLLSTGRFQWRMAQYQTLLAVFNLEVYSVTAFASQATIVSFCFMILIVVQTYNAQLGTLFSSSRLSSSINSMADLKGMPVGTYDLYQSSLQGLYPDVVVIGIPGGNTNDLFSIAQERLDDGSIKAFVFDVSSFVYRIANLPDPCEYIMLVDASAWALKFNYGFIFNWQWNRSVVEDLYLGLMHAQEAGWDVILKSKYIGSLPTCSGLASSEGVTFTQMSGLFVTVGAVTASCLVMGLFLAGAKVWNHMKEHQEDAEAQELQQQQRSPDITGEASQGVHNLAQGCTASHTSFEENVLPVSNMKRKSSTVMKVKTLSSALSKVFVNQNSASLAVGSLSDGGRDSRNKLEECGSIGSQWPYNKSVTAAAGRTAGRHPLDTPADQTPSTRGRIKAAAVRCNQVLPSHDEEQGHEQGESGVNADVTLLSTALEETDKQSLASSMKCHSSLPPLQQHFSEAAAFLQPFSTSFEAPVVEQPVASALVYEEMPAIVAVEQPVASALVDEEVPAIVAVEQPVASVLVDEEVPAIVAVSSLRLSSLEAAGLIRSYEQQAKALLAGSSGISRPSNPHDPPRFDEVEEVRGYDALQTAAGMPPLLGQSIMPRVEEGSALPASLAE